jgi:hypothetical protein
MKKEEKKLIYFDWKQLVNMSYKELKSFYNSPDGLTAGLSRSESAAQGIRNGRASARALLKMIPTGKTFTRAENNWTPGNWLWAAAQVAFIKRMRKVKGPLFVDQKRTPKLKALLIWGHNPENT